MMKTRKKEKGGSHEVMDETREAKILLNEGKVVFEKAVC